MDDIILSTLGHTWILDLDGTIVKHNGYKIDGHDSMLDGAESFLHGIPDKDMVIFLTSRTDDLRESTEAFLREHGIEDKTIRTICEIIGAVSFSQNRGKTPATLEGKIVQDADRLDALGAVGIARTFAYGGKAGRSLDDSIRHFHEKLLLLKDEMSTDAAKQIAVLRHRYMEEFLLEYDRETEA